MAVNKKDDKRFQNLTVDYRSLMRLNVSERMNMINSVEGRSVIANIEPEQVAAAFPNYYRKDTNVFGKKLQGLMSSPDSFTKPKSGDRSGLSESNRSALGVGRRRSDVGALKQLTSDQKQTIDLVRSGKVEVDDPRVGFLKDLSEDDLKKAGIQKADAEGGKKIYSARQMSDDEIAGDIKRNSAGTRGSNLKINQQEAYAALRQEGLSDRGAKIAVANFSGESLRNPTSFNKDYNSRGEFAHMASGIMQWDPSRSAAIQKQFGKLPHEMTVAEQVKATIWEMKKDKPDVWAKLKDDSVDDETRMQALVKDYTRPADWRGQTAKRLGMINGVSTDASYTIPPGQEPTAEQIAKYKEGLPAQQERYLASRVGVLPNQDQTVSSRVVERQGDVAAVRTQPIKQDLKSYLDYASQKSGVFYEVTSGGQSHGHGRTGSHRHDVDNPGTIGAADGKMYVIEGGKKRYLSINNEADQAQISEFTKRFSSVAPSSGVGAGYMGRGEARGQLFHFGGGNEQGDKTVAYEGPQWFREAHKAGTSIKPEDAQADFQSYQEQKMEAARKKAEAQLTEAPTPQNRSLRSYLDMKEQQAVAPVEPEVVSSMPDGGDLQTNTDSLDVYKMDKNKLQRDDSIALDDGGKPVFTMNSKESMKFDPNTGKVEVDNGSKGLRNDPNRLGPAPEPTARDRHEEKIVQTTGPAAAAARAEGPPPQSSTQSAYDLSAATMSMTDNMFKSPSFERAIARTRFQNSGDAALGGHFDGKAANMV